MSRGERQNAEWYADGLRFECTMCGKCCTGAPGYVGFTEQEAAGMARALGLEVDAFYVKYATREAGAWSLKEVETEHGHDCVLLDRTSEPGKGVCGVYGARPLQCRTFPWWPGNLESRRTWERLGRDCEGVGRGNFVPIEDIRIQRNQQGRRDGAVSR